jgi:hypothetical protein
MYKFHLYGLGLFLYLALGLVAIMLHFATLREVERHLLAHVASHHSPQNLDNVLADSKNLTLVEHSAAEPMEGSEVLPLFDTAASLYDYADRSEHLKRLESLSSFHATALAPLTAKAQRFLYDWQHPSNCTGRNYIVSEGNPEGGGLGSNLFVATHHFAIALDKGAIFLWRWNAAEDFIDRENCANTPGIECFVEAPSNCTLHDAFDEGIGYRPGVVEVRMGNAGQEIGFPDFHYVPRVFQQMWAEAGLPVEEGTPAGDKDPRAYWYKTQVVAYLARFNRVTVEALRVQRAIASNFMAASGPAVPFAHRTSMLTFPLPTGTMCAHIRHGDKEMEMRLVPTNLYMDAALKIADMQPLMTPSRNVFVSSEDPGALDFLTNSLAKVPEYNHWSIAWFSAMPRKDSNGRDQLDAFVDIIPKAMLTRLWFLQLTLALECDSWIGTRGSNWNKLIDVLRCVWVPKCQNYVVDVGDNVWR